MLNYQGRTECTQSLRTILDRHARPLQTPPVLRRLQIITSHCKLSANTNVRGVQVVSGLRRFSVLGEVDLA